ncbi:MAG TPA: hypothetical protein VGF77_07335 [Allosphingosinicella sp.]
MRYGWMAAALIGVAALAAAKPRAPATPATSPQAYQEVIKCRTVTEDSARLRCFDQAAAALQQAAERRDIVIVDRAQVRQTRRSLFGIEGLRLPFFGGGGDESEEMSQLDGIVASASQLGDGRWVIRLEEGGTWVQTDDNPISLWPKPGQKVLIRRAALGSYMMRINGQPGVRARRQF